MADVRESFPSLEDAGSGAGLPLHKALEGDVITAKNAQGALVAKRVSDSTFRYLNLDDAGNLLVSTDGGGTPMFDSGTASGNVANQTVAEITLTAEAVYHGLDWAVSCFRDAIFEIVAINDPGGTPTEQVLAYALCGPGDLTDSGAMPNLTFTAGDTDPVLRVRARNLNTTSDFRASVATTEDAA